jgi:uncharacterized protein (TIGR00725 family)
VVVVDADLAMTKPALKTVRLRDELVDRRARTKVDGEQVTVEDERELVIEERDPEAGRLASASNSVVERPREGDAGRELAHQVFRSIGVMPVQVSVIGSGVENEAAAEEVGRLLAERGVTVVCGGLGEVMAAAARGAKSAGGTTIGILPGTSRSEASEWIDHAVVTGIGHARNLAVAASGDGVIAVGGKFGTQTELGFALILGRPVVVLEPGPQVEGVARVSTPAEAVDHVLSRIDRS